MLSVKSGSIVANGCTTITFAFGDIFALQPIIVNNSRPITNEFFVITAGSKKLAGNSFIYAIRGYALKLRAL